jgi:prepilin-type N-terminal cleavage/methylation domain-containing protein
MIRKQEGFSLIEVMIAMVLLLFVVLAFAQLFTNIAWTARDNRAKLVATTLAGSVLEEIRAMKYDQIGLEDSNPAGILQHETTRTVDGITFNVVTSITWVDDLADDNVPYDYKRVVVSVSAPDFFIGRVQQGITIDTLGTPEAEQQIFEKGNIRVDAHRAWHLDTEDPNKTVPVKNVMSELIDGPDAYQHQYTEDSGKVIFAMLEPGSYTVHADASNVQVGDDKKFMMVRPGYTEKEVMVVEYQITDVFFEVEYPCGLILELRDAQSGQLVNEGGTLVLETPLNGDITKTFTAAMGGYLPADFLGPIWPVGEGFPGTPYNLRVLTDGHMPYNLQDNPGVWQGLFDAPGETRRVVLNLVPANATVEVSASSGTPVEGATVEICRDTYAYQGGTPILLNPSVTIATAVTSLNGRAAFFLPDNSETPVPPQEGSQYTRYGVKVNSEDYIGFGPEHGAFWMAGGKQRIASGEVNSYLVTLQPDSRQIKVYAHHFDGEARTNLRIRLRGPETYDITDMRTDENGYALFENLAEGTYTVRWGKKDNHGTVIYYDPVTFYVAQGEYFVDYNF